MELASASVFGIYWYYDLLWQPGHAAVAFVSVVVVAGVVGVVVVDEVVKLMHCACVWQNRLVKCKTVCLAQHSTWI